MISHNRSFKLLPAEDWQIESFTVIGVMPDCLRLNLTILVHWKNDLLASIYQVAKFQCRKWNNRRLKHYLIYICIWRWSSPSTAFKKLMTPAFKLKGFIKSTLHRLWLKFSYLLARAVLLAAFPVILHHDTFRKV